MWGGGGGQGLFEFGHKQPLVLSSAPSFYERPRYVLMDLYVYLFRNIFKKTFKKILCVIKNY